MVRGRGGADSQWFRDSLAGWFGSGPLGYRTLNNRRRVSGLSSIRWRVPSWLTIQIPGARPSGSPAAGGVPGAGGAAGAAALGLGADPNIPGKDHGVGIVTVTWGGAGEADGGGGKAGGSG